MLTYFKMLERIGSARRVDALEAEVRDLRRKLDAVTTLYNFEIASHHRVKADASSANVAKTLYALASFTARARRFIERELERRAIEPNGARFAEAQEMMRAYEELQKEIA